MPARLLASAEPGFEGLPAAAAEAHHRIANSLALIAGLIRVQARGLPDTPTLKTSDVRDWLQQMSVRIEAVGRLHRLVTCDGGTETVTLGVYLREIADAAMCSLTDAERTEISYDLDADCSLPARRGAAIGLLVGEAITNALKYAHPSGVAGKIHVASRSGEAGGWVIEIADDGVGLPEGFDPKTSGRRGGGVGAGGVKLMLGLAEQLCARLEFQPRPIGLCVRLELPPSALAETRVPIGANGSAPCSRVLE